MGKRRGEKNGDMNKDTSALKERTFVHLKTKLLLVNFCTCDELNQAHINRGQKREKQEKERARK